MNFKPNRLTQKDKSSIDYQLDMSSLFGTIGGQIYDKLSSLENIEEKIGINLETFFTLMEAKECYVKDLFGGLDRYYPDSICEKGLVALPQKFPYGECMETLLFKDYGKTWALTREELEK